MLAALRVLEEGTRRSLARPLALVCDGRAPARISWLLVLPSGALLVLHVLPRGRKAVATCFFPGPDPARLSANIRRRRLVARLVRRYGVVDAWRDGIFPLRGVPGTASPARVCCRFVTPAS